MQDGGRQRPCYARPAPRDRQRPRGHAGGFIAAGRRRRSTVNYIVEPQREEEQQKRNCNKYVTDCALCSEDPRFCGNYE